MSAPTITITEAGVYDMPADVYHADPVPGGSLSSSGARKLLPPSCPARYRYERDNPPEPKAVFDLGHAAHRHVLGEGPELVLVDRDRWDTKDVKAKVAAVRAEGGVPLKRPDYEMVQAMATAIRQHPIASALFRPGLGKPEQALFWQDRETGVWCRALLDWLPYFTTYAPDGSPAAGRGYPGRLIVPDYKTTRSAAPDDLQRAISSYGYHQQAAWYLDGIKALFPAYQHPQAQDPQFVFVFQEKEPPYLVTVAQPDPTALQIGQRLNREALRLYAECAAADRWPGYSDDVELIGLPAWVENQYKEIW